MLHALQEYVYKYLMSRVMPNPVDPLHEKILEGAEATIEALKRQSRCSLDCVNGVCRLDVNGLPYCLCADGYTGILCDVRIDYCDSNPCNNRGICVSLVGGYVCICDKQSSGRNCEIEHTASLALACDGTHLAYSVPGKPKELLYPGDYSERVVNDNGTLAYDPRSQLRDRSGAFYVNLETLPSIACTLIHYDDDGTVKGLVFATDAGNQHVGLWGKKVPTFIISREGVAAGRVLNLCASYKIYCL
jgi:hypothetical protein